MARCGRDTDGNLQTAFKSVVDKFTPANWRRECLTDIKAPAFPEKIEEAGY